MNDHSRHPYVWQASHRPCETSDHHYDESHEPEFYTENREDNREHNEQRRRSDRDRSTNFNDATSYYAHDTNEGRYPAQHNPASSALNTRRQSPVQQAHESFGDDVWLREKYTRISYTDADLRDAELVVPHDRGKALKRVAGFAATLGLLALLTVASTPDLSPQDIIAMDGYAGEQSPKTLFNPASLQKADIPGQESTGTSSAANLTASKQDTNAAWPDSNPTTTTGNTDPGDAGPGDAGPGNTGNAGLNNTSFDNAATSNGSSFSVIQASSTGTFNTDSSFNNEAPTSALYNNTGTALTVLQQWSNVRATADINSEILTSLAAGKTVTQIGESGRWIEVQVDEQPSVTGFMHRSTVAP